MHLMYKIEIFSRNTNWDIFWYREILYFFTFKKNLWIQKNASRFFKNLRIWNFWKLHNLQKKFYRQNRTIFTNKKSKSKMFQICFFQKSEKWKIWIFQDFFDFQTFIFLLYWMHTLQYILICMLSRVTLKTCSKLYFLYMKCTNDRLRAFLIYRSRVRIFLYDVFSRITDFSGNRVLKKCNK